MVPRRDREAQKRAATRTVAEEVGGKRPGRGGHQKRTCPRAQAHADCQRALQRMSGVRSTRILPRPTIVPGLAARLDIASHRPFLRGSLTPFVFQAAFARRCRPCDPDTPRSRRRHRRRAAIGRCDLACALPRHRQRGPDRLHACARLRGRGPAGVRRPGPIAGSSSPSPTTRWWLSPRGTCSTGRARPSSIKHVSVAVSLQRQGLEGRLLAHVCDKTRAAGATTLDPQCQQTQRAGGARVREARLRDPRVRRRRYRRKAS